MKRNIIALAAFAIATLTATAQNPELLIIDMNDGTTKTIPVADIKQLSFGTKRTAWKGLPRCQEDAFLRPRP